MNWMERYEELYENMAMSKDVRKMHVFGDAEKWAFKQMAASNPSVAQQWVEKLEAVCWNNYLSPTEANEIVSKLKWQDGRTTPKWMLLQFKQAVENAGGKVEEKPYYNEFALWATANMIVSDSGNTLAEYVSEEELPKLVYKLSVDRLKDADRPYFIREYFDL